ncbi:MAG TPA: hypothetical protein VG297_22960, partial [Bryobacteraceae bacterium]|nr:hypothetical protein [Bryobacteraceae bacterium]
KFLTIPQGGGIFSLPPAHILQVLLSTQTGWFVWTPLTLLGSIGLVLGALKYPRIYVPWIVILTLQIAAVGSVWFWSGVESFGARYLLSDTPLAALGLITLLSLVPSRARQVSRPSARRAASSRRCSPSSSGWTWCRAKHR